MFLCIRTTFTEHLNMLSNIGFSLSNRIFWLSEISEGFFLCLYKQYKCLIIRMKKLFFENWIHFIFRALHGV